MSTNALDRQIARLQLRIEQLRIYIAMLHPSQRSTEATHLKSAIQELNTLTASHTERQKALQTPAAA